MFGGGVRFCWRSVAPLRLDFSGDVGNAEATAAQRNNFSQPLLFSDGDLLRRQRRGWGDLSRSRGPAHRRLHQVMMLLTLLISRKMIFGENLSFARVAGGGIEGCVVGTGVCRCAWEAVYSADSPRSKPSFAASTLWRLALVPDDDWEAVSAAVSNGSLKASRKMNRSFGLLCNFPFLWGSVCERASVMR
ncbi:hypothetical protein PVAP13_5NG441820 [Panicum virgatum]|uniref:Uncharacterized protein n=1 Tax=Panicum virgatum TaxID=38727 RepID=A0A8T0RZ86_PANVG|nr:hypothetical protein PVAP13_5NG441820 [Panicum virgatum]